MAIPAFEAWLSDTLGKKIVDGTRPYDPLTRQELVIVLDKLGLIKK